MKKYFFLLLTVVLIGSACQKKEEPNKIVNNLPTDVGITVLPAQAAQQYIVLNNEVFTEGVYILNRLNSYATPTFPELQQVASGQYRYSVSNSKCGTAPVIYTFYSGASIIDPIAVHSTTNTVSSLTMEIAANSGVSALFTYSESLRLTLAKFGDLTSDKSVTGTSHFVGSHQDITFSIDASGILATTEGLSAGQFSGGGTGTSGQPVSLSLTVDLDHNANGIITWEGQDGQIHFDPKVLGVVMTRTKRLLVP